MIFADLGLNACLYLLLYCVFLQENKPWNEDTEQFSLDSSEPLDPLDESLKFMKNEKTNVTYLDFVEAFVQRQDSKNPKIIIQKISV